MYSIVLRKKQYNWQVFWNDKLMFEGTEAASHTFANALEMNTTNSSEPLRANSKIQIEGWMDYLEAFVKATT